MLAVFLSFGRYGTRLLCDLVDVTLSRQFWSRNGVVPPPKSRVAPAWSLRSTLTKERKIVGSERVKCTAPSTQPQLIRSAARSYLIGGPSASGRLQSFRQIPAWGHSPGPITTSSSTDGASSCNVPIVQFLSLRPILGANQRFVVHARMQQGLPTESRS
jgi:hypothetical protein